MYAASLSAAGWITSPGPDKVNEIGKPLPPPPRPVMVTSAPLDDRRDDLAQLGDDRVLIAPVILAQRDVERADETRRRSNPTIRLRAGVRAHGVDDGESSPGRCSRS